MSTTIILNETTSTATVTVTEVPTLASVAVSEATQVVTASVSETVYNVTAAIASPVTNYTASVTTTPQVVLARVFSGGTIGLYRCPAGEPIPAYSPVRQVGDLLYLTNAGDPALAHQTLGITLETGTPGNDCHIRLFGIVDNPAWAWNTGSPIFLGATGDLTQLPIGVAFWQQMAWPISPTRILVSLEEVTINATL